MTEMFSNVDEAQVLNALSNVTEKITGLLNTAKQQAQGGHLLTFLLPYHDINFFNLFYQIKSIMSIGIAWPGLYYFFTN